MIATRYVVAIEGGSEFITDCSTLAPRSILALECFAKLAKVTADLGKIEAHLESICDASTSSLIVVLKQMSGVLVRDEIGNVVLLEWWSDNMFLY
jgi:hypothetical protein